MKKKIIEKFGNRLRVRVCGILIEDDRILMVEHTSLGKMGIFWAPPGGGMNFGNTATENLRREFMEETGLEVDIIRFLFTHEFLQPPLHAIELFFEVKRTGGVLIQGSDPEMGKNEQIIKRVSFLSFNTLAGIDPEQLHHAFRDCRSPLEVLKKKGYINFDLSF